MTKLWWWKKLSFSSNSFDIIIIGSCWLWYDERFIVSLSVFIGFLSLFQQTKWAVEGIAECLYVRFLSKVKNWFRSLFLIGMILLQHFVGIVTEAADRELAGPSVCSLILTTNSVSFSLQTPWGRILKVFQPPSRWQVYHCRTRYMNFSLPSCSMCTVICTMSARLCSIEEQCCDLTYCGFPPMHSAFMLIQKCIFHSYRGGDVETPQAGPIHICKVPFRYS